MPGAIWAPSFRQTRCDDIDQRASTQAIENDLPVYLAELVMELPRTPHCCPSPAALERLALTSATMHVEAHQQPPSSAEQRKRLDALTHRREEGGQTWLTC